MQRMYSEERRVKSSPSAASQMVQKSHTPVGMREYNEMLRTVKSGRSYRVSQKVLGIRIKRWVYFGARNF